MIGAVVAALLPPLLLEKIINNLTAQIGVPLSLAFLYIAFLALAALLESARESLLTVFGQKITHGLRHALCAKLTLA